MIFRQLPTAGLPPQLQSWDDLERATDDMIRIGAMRQYNELRWDIRPSPALGTIEVRAADASTNIAEFAALAAFIQTVVVDAVQRLDRGETLPVLPEWIVRENKWRGSRFGLSAELATPDGEVLGIRNDVTRIVQRVMPVAEQLHCADELASFVDLQQFGESAARQRVVAYQGQQPLYSADPHAGLDSSTTRPIEHRRDLNLAGVAEYLHCEMDAGTVLDPAEFVG